MRRRMRHARAPPRRRKTPAGSPIGGKNEEGMRAASMQAHGPPPVGRGEGGARGGGVGGESKISAVPRVSRLPSSFSVFLPAYILSRILFLLCICVVFFFSFFFPCERRVPVYGAPTPLPLAILPQARRDSHVSGLGGRYWRAAYFLNDFRIAVVFIGDLEIVKIRY